MQAVVRRSMLTLLAIALIGSAAGLGADHPLASPESVGFSADSPGMLSTWLGDVDVVVAM